MQADQLESITSNTEDISADATVAVTSALESILESDEPPSEEVLMALPSIYMYIQCLY